MFYKGFEIEARPYNLVNGNYTLDGTIVRFESNHVKEYWFSANNEYPDKPTAVLHCLAFAKQLIDGKIQNCSVV